MVTAADEAVDRFGTRAHDDPPLDLVVVREEGIGSRERQDEDGQEDREDAREPHAPASLTDVAPIEVATLAPLVILAVGFGLFPALILDLITAPVDTVLAAVDQGLATGRLP